MQATNNRCVMSHLRFYLLTSVLFSPSCCSMANMKEQRFNAFTCAVLVAHASEPRAARLEVWESRGHRRKYRSTREREYRSKVHMSEFSVR